MTDKVSKYKLKAPESHKVASLFDESLLNLDVELFEKIEKISKSIDDWNKI